jgi:phage-related protein
MRKVIWVGDSRKVLKTFPEEVQKEMGMALMVAQYGEKAEL